MEGENKMYQPYVYRWEHTSGKYYIGSHTAKGSYPGDSYICSSKVVKPLIQQTPTEWRKSYLYIGETKEQVVAKEAEILQALDAKNDPMSYNQHNGDGKFIVKHNSPEARQKMSETKKRLYGNGKHPHIGMRRSEQVKQNISRSLKGITPWNKGKKLSEGAK